ncbi:DUF2530 domain-containing protein [Actinomadura graeca]|uniref:DUF2530 domain-containing protein n=1 Tax=Actinomadura graeca TaxID=2750812 RepID=A0ABX8R1I1_9ACTN|nr:DUF2530 domain-containing protein [Actinomadura graeca]QXJ24114.1 DUF2530 domain-containing protein [Actinomadura graeca]
MSRPRLPDPPPMRTDDVRIAAAGTAAWAVALVVLLIVGLPSGERWWLWVCVAGIVIGLFGMWYIPRLQAGRARLEETHSAGTGPKAEADAGDVDDPVRPEAR